MLHVQSLPDWGKSMAWRAPHIRLDETFPSKGKINGRGTKICARLQHKASRSRYRAFLNCLIDRVLVLQVGDNIVRLDSARDRLKRENFQHHVTVSNTNGTAIRKLGRVVHCGLEIRCQIQYCCWWNSKRGDDTVAAWEFSIIPGYPTTALPRPREIQRSDSTRISL